MSHKIKLLRTVVDDEIQRMKVFLFFFKRMRSVGHPRINRKTCREPKNGTKIPILRIWKRTGTDLFCSWVQGMLFLQGPARCTKPQQKLLRLGSEYTLGICHSCINHVFRKLVGYLNRIVRLSH